MNNVVSIRVTPQNLLACEDEGITKFWADRHICLDTDTEFLFNYLPAEKKYQFEIVQFKPNAETGDGITYSWEELMIMQQGIEALIKIKELAEEDNE